jgi:cell division protein FtsA
MEKNLLFALDIGTRSVVGLVGEKVDNQIQIIASHRQEHRTRAMMDGQIHDVPEVANIITEIKNVLEASCGPLKKVSIAAAGRALCTIQAKAELEISERATLASSDEHALELAAIQSAQHQLATSGTITDPTSYYCVGYSVVSFTLDNTTLKTLVGQRGKKASIELIATFLPRQVIDSLQSAVTSANLEIATLTLEPIAAINVLIPQTMRHLNLALVDIGAGTSDVAITKDGTIIAYGMVPCAGDEITEAISQQYLLDFNVAEKVKRQLTENQFSKINFIDVLGLSQERSIHEILKGIQHHVADLAQAIATQILALNITPPQAVLLVGGGSLTPMISEALAQSLDIPSPRVAVRRPDAIEGISQIPPDLCTPDAVTPLGILKLSASRALNFMNVTLNGQSLHLFNLGQLTVADALLAAGIDIRSLHGRPGLGITVNINDQTNFFPGTHGTPSMIELNGQKASLSDHLQEGDMIKVTKGTSGTMPTLCLSDIFGLLPSYTLSINEDSYEIAPIITINGTSVQPDAVLGDRDQVIYRLPSTLEEVLVSTGNLMEIPPYRYIINGNEREYSIRPKYTINQTTAQGTSLVNPNDQIVVTRPSEPTLGELLGLHNDDENFITVLFNKEKCKIPLRRFTIIMNDKPAQLTDIARNNSIINFSSTEQNHPIISDVLLAAKFNPKTIPSGSIVKILLNNQPTEYTSLVKNGDKITLVTA